jgi:ATP-dependent Clp protease ATP-binding subunit ClpA
MFERFTERARQVIVLAQDEARGLKHNYIGTEHLLLGLLREEEGLAARVLGSFDVTVEEVRAHVARIVGQGDEVTGGQIPFTPRSKKILELSLREALALGHNYIGTEHILLGLMRENEGVAIQILRRFDVDANRVSEEILRMLSGPGRRQIGEPAGRPPANLPHLVEVSTARVGEAARWQYDARTLEGATEAWPEQLTAWRREGWELLAVVAEEGTHRALLERRISS